MLYSIPGYLWRLAGDHTGVSRLEEKVWKFAERLDGCTSADELYRKIVTEWPTGSLVLGAGQVPEAFDQAAWVRRLESIEERMMAYDALTYLPDDILHKVDRAAMAVSLETRVPFLDHRVVEYAWRLPINMKIRKRQGKWALRQVLYKHVPSNMVDRPKSGFALPIGQWLKGPLREWASMLLEPTAMRAQGYLNDDAVTHKWSEHSKGTRDWTASLWTVLMFQAWLREGATG
jgi:asparagine synthase (glutamine-hydrolysing)